MGTCTKRIFLFTVLLVPFLASSQSGINNLDFENWDTTFLGDTTPTGFFSYKATRNTSTPQNGTSALKVTTQYEGSYFNDTLGVSQTDQPYTKRPDSVTGYVRYQLPSTDTGLVYFLLTKYLPAQNKTRIIGDAVALFPNSVYTDDTLSNWTKIKLDFNYDTCAVPDSLMVTFASETNYLYGIGSSTIGGVFEADNFKLYTPPAPVIDTVIKNDVACGNDGSIEIQTSNVDSCTKYSIDGGTTYSTDSVFTGLSNGTYQIEVSAASGVATSSVTISGSPLAIGASVNKDTICPGDSAQLGINTELGSDDFDGGYDPGLWSTVNNGMASTDCGSMSGDALYFYGAGTRNAISNSKNANAIDSIGFCIKFGTSSSPCEDADASDEVVLEYSTDGGTTWNTIDTYQHTIGTWTCFNVAVPAGAKTNSTLFKWEQPSHSGSGYDNWSIDNVRYIGDTTTNWSSVAWTPNSGLSDDSIKSPKASPSSTTTYTVIVTDSNGCKDTSSVTLNVKSFNVTASASVDSVCKGDSVYLYANSNFSGTSFGWSPTSKTICDTCTSTQAGPLNAATQFVLTGKRGGCMDKDSVTVGVAPIPNVSASNDTTICYGDAVQISASGAQSYTWSPVNGLSDPNVQDPLASPGDSITYTVTGTDANGCSNEDSLTLKVEGGPVLATADNDSLCPGDSVQLHAVPDAFNDDFDGGGYDGSVWSTVNNGSVNTDCGSKSGEALHFGGSGTRNAITQSFNTNNCSMINFCIKFGDGASPCEDADGGDDVSLEYSTDGGVTWTQIALYQPSNYKSWSCLSVPMPAGASSSNTMFKWEQVNHAGSGTDHWALDEVSFDCGSGGGWTYSWSPSSNMSDPSAQDPMASFDGKTSYKVTATQGNCSFSDQVTVYEGSIDLAVNSSDATCGNKDGSAWVTPSNGSAPYTYQWNDSNNQTNDTAKNLAAGSYKVTVTDSKGCSSSKTVIVDDNGTVSANIYDHSDPSCHGSDNGYAVASVSGGTSPYSIKWDDPNGQTGDTASGLSGGVYTVTATDQNGCKGIDTVHIQEPDSIEINVSSSPASCGSCSDGIAWANATGGTPPFTYDWNDSMNQNGDTAYSLAPGTYKVTVTDADGCSNAARVTVGDGSGTSIADRKKGSGGMFRYYPNPVRNKVTVEYRLKGEDEPSLVLMDQVGKVVDKVRLEGKKGRYRLDVSDRASGIYFIGIRQEDERPMHGKLFIGR